MLVTSAQLGDGEAVVGGEGHLYTLLDRVALDLLSNRNVL